MRVHIEPELDSTVLIDYLRGRPIVERVSAMDETGDISATGLPMPEVEVVHWPVGR